MLIFIINLCWQFLQIMAKIDQKKLSLDYHSLLIGQPLKICIKQKAFQMMSKFYLLCWHNALYFLVPFMPNYASIIDTSLELG